jgi:hypothetical protein
MRGLRTTGCSSPPAPFRYGGVRSRRRRWSRASRALRPRHVSSEYDSYYYSRVGQTPLPALRIKFDDPAETWVYVDPSLSQVVTAINRWGRVERWVYHGLHSLDFAFLYNSRPAWDIVMLAISLGGLTTSGLGFVLGLRRMRRAATRLTATVEDMRGVSAGRS